jgi:hypothetical protein
MVTMLSNGYNWRYKPFPNTAIYPTISRFVWNNPYTYTQITIYITISKYKSIINPLPILNSLQTPIFHTNFSQHFSQTTFSRYELNHIFTLLNHIKPHFPEDFSRYEFFPDHNVQVFTAAGLLAARLEGASCRKAEASQVGPRGKKRGHCHPVGDSWINMYTYIYIYIYIYGTPPQAKVLLLYHDIYNSL